MSDKRRQNFLILEDTHQYQVDFNKCQWIINLFDVLAYVQFYRYSQMTHHFYIGVGRGGARGGQAPPQ